MRIQIAPRSTLPARHSPAPRDGGGNPQPSTGSQGRKTAIAPANLQEHLESAANAGVKGQAQYFTPPAWAKIFAQALPNYRPVLVDLTCGNGQLLAGAAAPSTNYFLGCDIEQPSTLNPQLSARFVQADLTRFYPLLKQADFVADCFVLNFPWDLHQYRDRLAGLAESECPAVELAFAAHDGRTGKDTIDSTIAGLCIALDLCSSYGEGFIIANEDTLQRLIFGSEARGAEGALRAPHRALAAHVWAHLTIDGGNICDPAFGKLRTPHSEFRTGVVWFARSHMQGCGWNKVVSIGDEVTRRPLDEIMKEVDTLCSELGRNRINFRRGTFIRTYDGGHTPDSADLWSAARSEWLVQTNDARARAEDKWNIWLDADGTIKTNLTLFDQATGRVKKEQYMRLYSLNGKHPMQLILQKSERKELHRAVFGSCDAASQKGGGGAPAADSHRSPWRVAPAVTDAVKQALAEYDAVRAPLYPQSKIQRLGYLDDNDDILCTKDAFRSQPSTLNPQPVFRSGTRYTIRTETIRIKRSGTKLNLNGERDEVEWEGSELALFIRDAGGIERLFMEQRLRDNDVTLSIQNKGAPSPIEYNLQDLVEHFEIPVVPDVSLVHPEAYKKNLALLEQIEAICNDGRPGTACPVRTKFFYGDRFAFKQFQREDYARAALHDGVVLGHDTGGGKMIAAYVWPCLKVGFRQPDPLNPQPSTFNRLEPLEPVLIVAPGDLHKQMMDEAAEKFHSRVTPLDSQDAFRFLSNANPVTGRRELAPGFYITSYTQLTGNGVIPFPDFDRSNVIGMMQVLGLTDSDSSEFFDCRAEIYAKHYRRLDSLDSMTLPELQAAARTRKNMYPDNDAWVSEIETTYNLLAAFHCDRPCPAFTDLPSEKKQIIRGLLVEITYKNYSESIGSSRWFKSRKDVAKPDLKIKCIYSPSLADLCQDSFGACAVDEGVRMKGEETIIGTGVRQITSRFKMVLTATPIKNRLPDVFRLAWWATGARAEAHARFPYPDDAAAREEFANEFLVAERNLTREKEKPARYRKLTPQVCNIHRLWKMFAPIILRRRKADFGEDIVSKQRHVVRAPMGAEQAAVYRFHLKAKYTDKNGMPAIGAQLQALRIASANPVSELLKRPYGDGKTRGEPRSQAAYIPKLHSALALIHQCLERGEQVIVFSAFHDSLDVLSARLTEAGVAHALADGRTSQKRRGTMAAQFKLGPGKSPHAIMLAGVECMAEGHSFNLCNNVILLCYSWAYDKFEQAINRVHRLNSRWDVNVYPIICDRSIDRKLEAMIEEKGNAAELVLDGRLLGEESSEVNLAELLDVARKEFFGDPEDARFKPIETVDEKELEKEWPALRSQLSVAAAEWRIKGFALLGLPRENEVLLQGEPEAVPAIEALGDEVTRRSGSDGETPRPTRFNPTRKTQSAKPAAAPVPVAAEFDPDSDLLLWQLAAN